MFSLNRVLSLVLGLAGLLLVAGNAQAEEKKRASCVEMCKKCSEICEDCSKCCKEDKDLAECQGLRHLLQAVRGLRQPVPNEVPAGR